jgi:1-acyl-sn-glycerol-3-phosphate acyltransferase
VNVFGKYDAHSRPRPHSFRPPKRNPLVIAICKRIISAQLRTKLKVTEVDISDADIDRLRDLLGKRCLLLPSHSGGFEPYVILYLAKLLDTDCNYLAAMEAFEQSPFMGWVMPRMGAYSIIRGAPDRPSFQMTKKLLVEAKRWLVIFPEGQTVWQNDTVIPFQQGVIQIAFKALREAVKADSDASLYCVPIAIKYVYPKNMDHEMDASLARLESQLFARDDVPPRERYDRLHRISLAVLEANERKHGVASEKDADFDDRIQKMKTRVVSEIEQKLGVTPRHDQVLLDRIRTLFNTVDRITQEEPGSTPYEQKLVHERQQEAQDLYNDLWRVLQFIAIYGDYVAENTTVERFMDVLCLLEKEVFDERRMWGPRRALVKVGAPLDLKEHGEAYRGDKRGEVRKVTLSLETSVRNMLEGLGGSTT